MADHPFPDVDYDDYNLEQVIDTSFDTIDVSDDGPIVVPSEAVEGYDRSDDYDDSKVWSELLGAWVDPGKGDSKTVLVSIAHKKIYFEAY